MLKSEQLKAAGQALVVVGQQVADTREARDAMADLGEKPPVYQAPPGTPGVEVTDEELAAQAAASAARQQQRDTWQSDYDKQEAKSLALTKEMDATFISAIPPMQAIHGQQDPTEPPPDVPSGPPAGLTCRAPRPPPSGTSEHGTPLNWGLVVVEEPKHDDPPPPPPVVLAARGAAAPAASSAAAAPSAAAPSAAAPSAAAGGPDTGPTPHPTPGPTTSVIGSSQSGITFDPSGSSTPTPVSAGSGASSGASAAALGAAGGAGGMAAGAMRPGAIRTTLTRGTAPLRSIGSTGRAGSAGALSRSGGSTSAGRAGAAGGRGSSTGSAGGRGAGSGAGSRSGSRGVSGASGRGGRKGEDEKSDERDSLVYDQDWLGDDDVAPGVLDWVQLGQDATTQVPAPGWGPSSCPDQPDRRIRRRRW